MRSKVWRLAAAVRNRTSRGPGHRPPGTTTWLRGARCTGCGGNAADGSAAPGRKIATVERRKARVLRHKRVHARLTTHYGTQGASQAPGRATSLRVQPDAAASGRLSALRPPLAGGTLFHHPGAIAPRERDRLFDK